MTRETGPAETPTEEELDVEAPNEGGSDHQPEPDEDS